MIGIDAQGGFSGVDMEGPARALAAFGPVLLLTGGLIILYLRPIRTMRWIWFTAVVLVGVPTVSASFVELGGYDMIKGLWKHQNTSTDRNRATTGTNPQPEKSSGPHAEPGSGGEAPSQGIETRLNNVEVALSLIPTKLERIETGLANAGAALSPIPTALEGINNQLLDMRVAQPVDLSYLKGADCRGVQQALKELGAYNGRINGICDGATNAAARRWQLQERRTIPAGQPAQEIMKTLRTPRNKAVNAGQ